MKRNENNILFFMQVVSLFRSRFQVQGRIVDHQIQSVQLVWPVWVGAEIKK
jgi:hypothetical protein